MFSFLKRQPSPHEVPHEEMTRLCGQDGSCIIDVREPHEYAAGHVPGAMNLPLSRFDASAVPTDRPVVLVCQSGGRSMSALRALVSAGYGNVRHYAPGFGGWRMRGGDVHFPRR